MLYVPSYWRYYGGFPRQSAVIFIGVLTDLPLLPLLDVGAPATSVTAERLKMNSDELYGVIKIGVKLSEVSNRFDVAEHVTFGCLAGCRNEGRN
jgi:hypothetical protein